eukprot:jgi/Galph1/5609/GphlegSOOS_G4263.1
MLKLILFLFVLGSAFPTYDAFYLPGIAPVDYEEGAKLDIVANKLTSAKNPLPYDYYYLPYCKGTEDKELPVNLGQLLLGERAKITPYEVSLLVDETCKILCTKTLDKEEVQKIEEKVREGYRARLNLDNLPVVAKAETASGESTFYLGYPVGFQQEENTYINNHLRFIISYHKPEQHKNILSRSGTGDVYRIVGFEVIPFSVHHEFSWLDSKLKTCPVDSTTNSIPQKVEQGAAITFTYDIIFKESPIQWATRWDPLLNSSEEQKQIQWFSIINSLMITLFLTGLVAMIMLRTVHQDFARYNRLDEDEDIHEETGWKLVHGDVFRPPPYPKLFAVACGTGAQLVAIAFVTLIFAVLGFLSPANRGGLLQALIALYILSCTLAGFVSARLYKTIGGKEWKQVTTMTGIVFPAAVFAVFFVVNLFVWSAGSTGTVSFLTLLFLLFLWFGISLPLVFLGAYFGYRKKSYELPVRTNQIPRQIPRQTWYNNSVITSLVGGILPFGAVFIELVFILSSLWQNQIYYMFGFLFVVFSILVLTSGEISIVLCYLKLCSEDYRWWWYSFFASGSSAFYLLGYSIFYLLTQPNFKGIGFVPVILYLGYMSLISLAFFLLTGVIGFYSCFWFTRKIYSSIRVD